MADLKKKIKKLKTDALAAVEKAADEESLASVKTVFLGRKGKLTTILRQISEEPVEERPQLGKMANEAKVEVSAAVDAAIANLKSKSGGGLSPIDVTMPGRHGGVGSIHPVSRYEKKICDIFSGMGFEIARGPEIEKEYYNFEALNFLPDHPARDMQDTLYVHPNEILLRTHTSPMQVRVMENRNPPLRVVCPGKTFRADTPDATHSPMFHQVEGFMVGEKISLADLKGVLTTFVRRMYGPDTPVRFRPSFFPFTEPSAEIDIGCQFCAGEGCRVCKKTGWLEILGAGMINPAVFKYVGYDPEKYTGFAFGVGIERVAMLSSGINDIRMFYENDLRFLSQF